MLIAQKTPVWIVRGRQRRIVKQGWINGTLDLRIIGTKRVFVYHYVRGELLCSVMPIKNISPIRSGGGQLQLGL